jgi:hypothetical protein
MGNSNQLQQIIRAAKQCDDHSKLLKLLELVEAEDTGMSYVVFANRPDTGDSISSFPQRFCFWLKVSKITGVVVKPAKRLVYNGGIGDGDGDGDAFRFQPLCAVASDRLLSKSAESGSTGIALELAQHQFTSRKYEFGSWKRHTRPANATHFGDSKQVFLQRPAGSVNSFAAGASRWCFCR